jgi:thiamine-phosphate pyrophosphorylase
MDFPRFYAILDVDLLTARSIDLASYATQLRDAGVELVQYRNKQGSARVILNDAALLKNLFAGSDTKLIVNDRADLTLLADCNGVHVGQDDLSAEDARAIVGPNRWVGISTHSPEQVIAANETTGTYIAYGPIFPTASKINPDPTVGLAGLRTARALTKRPLVAIGGITVENCRAALDAGADSIAVISALLPASKSQATKQIAEEFLARLG